MKLTGQGHEVTLLTRGVTGAVRDGYVVPHGACVLVGDPTQPGPWQDRVAEHQVVVNLAGASIFSRWTRRNRQRIVNSRVLTTRNIASALVRRKGKETHLLSVSGVGYYGHHGDETLDETGPPGNDFLAKLASQWEHEALAAREFNVRVVICRLGHVLGTEGGVLPKLVTASKLGVGSTWGNGQQWLSWIHKDEVINILSLILQNNEISGPVNVTAPNPIRNREMARLLAEDLHRTMLIPSIPSFLLKLLLGEFASVFLNGQRVLPHKLLDNGYHFKYPTMQEAFADLLSHQA